MKHYFFIGIGGIGMSGLAKILLEQRQKVSGSELVHNKQTDELEKLGAEIFYEQNGQNLDNSIDVVVISGAINSENLDRKKAEELNLEIITRTKLLNEIASEQKMIAITGTHGKTTTSAMIATILEKAGESPTAIVGAEVKAINSNARYGEGEHSVVEACEYQKAFLDLHPYASVITNIEADHLDCYKDLDEIIATFSKFVSQISKEGFLVFYGEDENIQKAISSFTGEKISYGKTEDNIWQVKNISSKGLKTRFSAYKNMQLYGDFELKIPGEHNVLNALSAIATCDRLGVDYENIKSALADFTGADRRFQLVGEKNGVTIIDDYGHHPTEIKATLAGARNFYPENEIIAVFQPHQHSRTKFLLKEFADSFDDADKIIIPEIYAVRDTTADIASVSSKDLVDLINKKTPGKAQYFKTFEETAEYLGENLKDSQVIITIGAGPVDEVGRLVVGSK